MKSQVEINQSVRRIFGEIVGIDPEGRNLKRDETPGWDSLRQAELILKLQEEFGVHFSTQEIICCESYNEILEILSRKIRGQ